MSNVRRSALVPYSAADMFALVEDIESYPRFLPWCHSTRILSRREDEVKATIELVKGAIQERFSTRNRLHRHRLIEIRLLEGPFLRLEGCWRFEALGSDACQVTLDMDFEFSSVFLRMVVGPIFKRITHSLVDAFCSRAREVYGEYENDSGGSRLRASG